MVQGMRTAQQVIKASRDAARQHGWTFEQLPKRGKGSHTIWSLRDETGTEIGRLGLTGHAGPMSRTVTRNAEQALEPNFGEGWLD